MDRPALVLLALWTGLVLAVLAIVVLHEGRTLGYPVARVLFEDQFRSVGDGHLIPREGESVTPAFAALFIAPVFWLHQMSYFPLEHLLGSAHAITIGRLNGLILYLLGTPIVYRLLRHGKADPWVAFVFAAAYAASPFVLTRMLVCNVVAPAPFLLWSELGRVEGRPKVRAIGLLAASFSYPLTGFAAVILAFQDYRSSTAPHRRTHLRILVATACALAVAHFGVLGLWNRAHPESHELHVGRGMLEDFLSYRIFPFDLGPWSQPVKLFEIAVLIAGSCVLLLAHPWALAPAIVDFLYDAGTAGGVRDHTMVLSTVGLATVLGVRASLFEGGNPSRNRVLVAGALFATLYGHALAGPNGLIALALAPTPPRPHLADVGVCIAPGHERCVVPHNLYAGFGGRCEQVATYEPADLEDLRIEDTATTVFVAPSRLDCRTKNTTCGPLPDGKVLGALAAKIRSGELHASVCPPWFVLVRSRDSAPNDPSAADLLEHPPPL